MRGDPHDPYEGHDPHFGRLPPGRPHLRFSLREIGHLVGAAALASLAFVIAQGQIDHPIFAAGQFDWHLLFPTWPKVWGAVLAVTSGFVLHELAHKVVAQRYGFWAEFRAMFRWLLLMLPISLTGYPVLAPGAVMIRGRVSIRQNGLISLAGPATNIVIALAAWPFAIAQNPHDTLPTIMASVALVNAFLAVLNLLPFRLFYNLDGRKVLWWNKGVYAAAMAIAVVLMLAILVTVAG